ncbi:Similar to CG2145: Poly(U)-specific endoribonuclease homolog (Drosophila melanogaster) [Cotesia congregata]|uniref:Similar to CG2145: Poly(U)-specific endoribonuclease homolog (Drosophila melanogaster) n=1 Tax=Cotesia congregata TaxID=51543 RepID=A0A8J2HJJ1_COTCN|nr:Similar to CG2145: Poly(U)-specific endoribonuclease homolog (Drosophila melanogaster) [Cotesia congregata]
MIVSRSFISYILIFVVIISVFTEISQARRFKLSLGKIRSSGSRGGGSRGSGSRGSTSYSPPRPSTPVYHPPVNHPPSISRPVPITYSSPPSKPATHLPSSPKDSSGALIHHEIKSNSNPSSNPPWANPSYKPSALPVAPPKILPPNSASNIPKPSAPFASQPIIPKSVTPNQSNPPYPTGHPVEMPHVSKPNTNVNYHPNSAPITPHQAPNLGNSYGHPPNYYPNNYHQPPPVYGAPPGSHGGYAPPPPYSSVYHPPAGTPNYHPTYVHPPVYGGASSQPFVPGQNVVVVPGNSKGPGIGQLVKEAVVFSTVNAGVNAAINRVINGAPSHYYHNNPGYSPAYSAPNSPSVTNNTTIIYNNVPPPGQINAYPNVNAGYDPNYNNQPNSFASNVSPSFPNNGNISPSIPNNSGGYNSPQSGSNVPVIFSPKFGDSNSSTTISPNLSNQTSLYPTLSNLTENPNNAKDNYNATLTPVIPEIQYYITENELLNLTEHLFMKDEMNKLPKAYVLNFQKKVSNSSNITDEATQPLIYVKREVYEYKTVQLVRELYENYQFNSTNKENVTEAVKEQERALINTISDTNVMKSVAQWLQEKYYVEPDNYEFKDTLRHIWFNRIDKSTSGFERIFMGEMYDGPSLLGVQNWIYYDFQEYQRNLNYLSFVDKIDLSANASLVKINLELFGVLKPNITMLTGISPELEMALYTICFYARPNDICPVSLGGIVFNLYTHNFRYFDKDVIDLGFIVF